MMKLLVLPYSVEEATNSEYGFVAAFRQVELIIWAFSNEPRSQLKPSDERLDWSGQRVRTSQKIFKPSSTCS